MENKETIITKNDLKEDNTATKENVKEDKDFYSKCEICEEYYDPSLSPTEIKEGGTYMCNNCWDEPI